MKEIISIIVVGLLWFGAIALRADDRYVVAPGTIAVGVGGDYKSWGTAATQIQWAVDVATNTETVWVSNGVYVLTNQILITNAIILRSTNGPNLTVINGGFTGVGVAGETTNKRCLFMSNAASFVSGFTISNGATMRPGAGVYMPVGGILSNCYVCNNSVICSNAASDALGGGIYTLYSTVTACRVYGNLATNLVAYTAYGGGIYAAGSGEMVGCLISNNYCGMQGGGGNDVYGGGALISGYWSVKSCMIISNYSSFWGGGICLWDGATMNSCTVTLNRAAYIAGVMARVAVITNCEISFNTTLVGYTSGLHMAPNYGAGYNCEVYNTTIISNTPRDGVNMTGLLNSKESIMKNCIISGNGDYGVVMQGAPDSYLYNCVISGNGYAGVLLYRGHVRNCLITGNTNGGGLLIGDFLPWGLSCKTALVSCCTITSNRSTSAGSGIRIASTAPNIFSISSCVIYSNGVSGTDDVYDACSPTNIGAIQYSCVGTNPGGYFTGAGIKVANPQFADFAAVNYRLAANSPCINTGSNETWMTNSVDRDGRTRIRYGKVDMGAYERINDGSMYGFR